MIYFLCCYCAVGFVVALFSCFTNKHFRSYFWWRIVLGPLADGRISTILSVVAAFVVLTLVWPILVVAKEPLDYPC